MIRQSKKVLTADFPPKKVVFHTETCAPYILNAAAAAIWDFCMTPKSDGEIIEYLRRTYGISGGEAKKDSAKFVKELKVKGLINVYERKK